MTAGLVIRDPDTGAVLLDQQETLLRIVWQEEFAYLAAATRHLPGFDSTRGVLLLSYSLRKSSTFSGNLTDQGDDYPWTQYVTNVQANIYLTPKLTWDNATRILTIAPSEVPINYQYPARPVASARSACRIKAVLFK